MTYRGRSLVRFALALVASAVVLAVAANPATAAVNDGYEEFTTDGCGSIEFVDFGTMNGRDNDDFFLVHDYCTDSHGVRAWVRTVVLDENGNPVSIERTRYNGNGYAGPPVAWDPLGNVLPGQTVRVNVCLVDGASDTTPFRCRGFVAHRSVDG